MTIYITTKLELDKSWDNASNFPNFLEDNTELWEEIILEVLNDQFLAKQLYPEIEVKEKGEGCWFITSALDFLDKHPATLTILIEIIRVSYPIIKEKINKKGKEVEPTKNLPQTIINIDKIEIKDCENVIIKTLTEDSLS